MTPPATTPPTSLRAVPDPAASAPPGGFAALERFWNDHSTSVFRAAYRVTGNAADAEDVLQTVFLRLARITERRDADRQDGGTRIKEDEAGAYLYRSAVNAALDIMRSRQRAGWVPLEPAIADGPSLADTYASDAHDPEHDQRNRELRANLRLAIARLSPRSAEIFALRYFEEMSNREIASLLGVSQGLVAVLLHRTRARLRKELATLEGVAR